MLEYYLVFYDNSMLFFVFMAAIVGQIIIYFVSNVSKKCVVGVSNYNVHTLKLILHLDGKIYIFMQYALNF